MQTQIPAEQIARLTDQDAVALTLWAEGRGESILGRAAIGCVIRNRMARRALSAKAVCLQPMQFSCWQEIDGKRNHEVLAAMVEAVTGQPKRILDPVLIECYWIADGILGGDVRDMTHGADHYVATRLLSSTKKPSWIATMDWTATVESHAFYRSRR